MVNAQQVASSSRARALKYAYLIEDVPDNAQKLTDAFSHSFGRWAGRHTLFVYVQNGAITPKFFSWLQTFDPDVVVTYTRLPDKTIEDIERKIAPLWFWQPLKRQNGELYGPWDNAASLSSLSILPQYMAQSAPWGEPPKYLLDSFPQWVDDGLIGDNFGVLRNAQSSFPAHPSIQKYLEPLNLIPPDAPVDRYHMKKFGMDITSDVELLGRMARHDAGIVTMNDLASRDALQHSFEHNDWALSFNLVVGDSIVDRICSWNTGLLSTGWGRPGLNSLRVPSARFASADFVTQLVAFLNARNFIGQRNGPPKLTIRSHSKSLDELTAIMDKLRPGIFSTLNVEHISSADECCPTMTFKQPYVPDRVAETLIQVPNGQLQLPAPEHLVDREDIPLYMRSGQWIVDASIERHVNHSQYSNVTHSWRLPNKKALARLFFKDTEVRVNTHGTFSVLASVDQRYAPVNLPEDDEVFRRILHDCDYYNSDDARYKEGNQKAPFRDSRRGDKGRYLIGVIQLFGGLDGAIRAISSHFWRSRFLEMAAPNKNATSLEGIVEKLRARFHTNGGLNVDTEEDWLRLAGCTQTVAQELRKPEEVTTVAKLKKYWDQELNSVRLAQPGVIKEGETNEAFIDELTESLQLLRDLGVFAQGYMWRCRSCGHKNWVGMHELAQSISCEICRRAEGIPVQFDWHFQLNEFLATSLREHDTLSLIWALGELRMKAKNCFAFVPPTELMHEDREDRNFVSDAEIDLMCIIDGQLVILEAKDAPKQFSPKSQEKIEMVARSYRPDRVVIACMSEASKIRQKVKQLETTLASDGIMVDLLELDDKSWNEPEFYLP